MTQDIDGMLEKLKAGPLKREASGWRFIIENGKHVGINEAKGMRTGPAASRIAARILSSEMTRESEKRLSVRRDVDGRLFPDINFDNGFRASLQADTHGYACSPRSRLDTLRDYESVEMVIYHDDVEHVDTRLLGLPDDIRQKFAGENDDLGPHIGSNVSIDEVEIISNVLSGVISAPGISAPEKSEDGPDL